jgi:beta-lactamase class A
MDRRAFLSLAAPSVALAGPTATTVAIQQAVQQTERRESFLVWRQRLLDVPGDKSFLIRTGGGLASWQGQYRPDAPLFVGSAIKTFILARFLQKVEAGDLSEGELLPVDDGIRSLVSPVFGANADASANLNGKATARTALEAMISHSDNTGTDMALKRVGADDVRAFIASEGLSATLIPDSTRVMISYLAGAPYGVDKGWDGMLEIMNDQYFGTPRSPFNGQETMISTATEMVSHYERALAGEFFSKPETLKEFKRIQAMADLVPGIVPAGIAAYGKGGSIDWQDFHALCGAGQMIVSGEPVTFYFALNWTGSDEDVPAVSAEFVAATAGMLAAVAGPLG